MSRITEAIETASELSNGKIIANVNGEDNKYSENFSCPNHFDVIFSDVVVLASTKLKVEMANRQSSNRVRAYAHTLHVGFEVSCDLQVGCVA